MILANKKICPAAVLANRAKGSLVNGQCTTTPRRAQERKLPASGPRSTTATACIDAMPFRDPERRRAYRREQKAKQRRRGAQIPVNAPPPDSIKAKGAKFGECTFRARFSPAHFTSSLFAAFAQFRELLLLGDSIESP
jgi:hypothetical protein